MPQSNKKAIFKGSVPAHVKFEFVKAFEDGSYLSWIAPDFFLLSFIS